jgi:membrane protease subunit (stomatin/prohibitin family)
MGLWDKIFGELIDVIEWTDDTDDTMVYRFDRYGNEIKYGAMLTVRESQLAILVNEGQIADVFEPGLYQLETSNLPILSTLQAWKHGFESPFKAEVYFFNTRRFTDLKWGTRNPIMIRDPEFGPLRLRAFGTYSIRIKEPIRFIKEIVGTDSHFMTDEITDQLRNLIVSRFATILAESRIPAFDLAASYDQVGEFLTAQIAPEFLEYGLELTKLLVENISFPRQVEEALDRRTSMGLVGNLDKYTKFQAAESMRTAADSPAGGAAEGIGMGMGFAMAHQWSRSLGNANAEHANKAPPSTDAAPIPPPIPKEISYFVVLEGQQTGPFKLSQIHQQISEGQLHRKTLVWTEGMENWKPAEQVEALSKLFAKIPPPIPPA